MPPAALHRRAFLLAPGTSEPGCPAHPRAHFTQLPLLSLIVFPLFFSLFSIVSGIERFASNVNWLYCISARFRIVNPLYFSENFFGVRDHPARRRGHRRASIARAALPRAACAPA